MTIARINLPAMVFQVGVSPEEWQVEAIDDAGDGACYVTTFSGPNAHRASNALGRKDGRNVPGTFPIV
jgi:hypothetical protein